MKGLLLAALLIMPAAAETSAPRIESVSPTTARAGLGDFILRVRGSKFTSSSIVRWNGADRVTAVIGPDLLTAMIPASDVAQPGEGRVTVYDPGAGVSDPVSVPIRASTAGGSASARVENPMPIIDSVAPASAMAGSPTLKVLVKGRGFTPLTAVRWRGAPRRTRYVRTGTLEVELRKEDLAIAMQGWLTARNPLPGGGVSAARTFPVLASTAQLDRPRVYPNPWRAGRHDGVRVSFENLARRSTIQIFTVTGSWIKTIPAGHGVGEWDLTDGAGRPVRGGAYVYQITDGRKTVEGKLKVSR